MPKAGAAVGRQESMYWQIDGDPPAEEPIAGSRMGWGQGVEQRLNRVWEGRMSWTWSRGWVDLAWEEEGVHHQLLPHLMKFCRAQSD